MKENLAIPENSIGKLWFSDSPNLDYFHQHDELECNIVCNGRGSYIVQDKLIELEASTIVWLFPGQEHLMLNTSADFALWILVIRPSYLRQSCVTRSSQTLLERNPAGLFVRHIDHSAFNKLDVICKDGVAAEGNLDLHNAIMGHLLHVSWDSFLKGSVIPLKQNIHPIINQIARRMVNEDVESLHTLAKEVGLSAETVSRLFKKQTGISFSRYRNRCRLDRFLHLYGDGYALTMLDAAREAGFGSYAQFYRVFSEMMKQSPASYRKQQLGKR